MGDEPDPDDPDGPGWAAHLAWVEATMMDEHHHWAVLWPDSPDAVLLDPNGPGRGEPYLQPAAPVTVPTGPTALADGHGGFGAHHRRYDELGPGDPDRALAYDPDDDWAEIADEVYPGLRQAVRDAAGA